MEKRIVSLDIGIKTIGIAVSDPLWMFPVPLGTVKRGESIYKDLDLLAEKISEYEIAAFVVGWPLHTGGEESTMTSIVRGFQKRLQKKFPDLPIFREDERDSTREAMEIGGVSLKNKMKMKRSGKIDSMAAAVILKNFMMSTEFHRLRSEISGT